MRLIRTFTKFILLISLSVWLIACGGGSGPNGGTTRAAFNKAGGFNDTVNVIAPAADGSGDIYVGGKFTTYDTTSSNRIVRLNSDATLDTGFAIGTGFNGFVEAIAPAMDGSGDIYVGGVFFIYDGISSRYIVRLNSDGTRDTGFAIGAGLNNLVFSIAPAADGSGDIYVGGRFTTYNWSSGSNRIVRLNSDGTLDTGFATSIGFNGNVNGIALAGDGSGDIYAIGNFSIYNTTGSRYLIRLNGDGTPETGFAIGAGFGNVPLSIASAEDGSGDVYVGGAFTTYDGTASNRFVHLNSDGSLDTGFAIGAGFNDIVYSIATAADSSGDIYVGGSFTTYNGTGSNYIVRLNSDGTLDTGFAIGTGFDSLPVNSIAPAMDGSGDIYVGGWFTAYNGTGSNYIVRLNSDGTLDTGFTIGVGFNSAVQAIAPAADGSGDIYVGGGFTTYNGTGSNSIARLNSDGTLDTGFAIGVGFFGAVEAIAPAADGSGDIYVGGAFTRYNGTGSNFIARLNSDGTLDTAFAIGNGFNSNGKSIVPAADGSDDVFIGGNFTSYQTTTVDHMVRLNPAGALN